MGWVEWVAIGAAVLAVVAVVVAGVVYQRQREMRRHLVPSGRSAAAAGDPVARVAAAAPLLAFVANPSKPDVAALRAEVRRACAQQYLPEPLWLETTVEDPGVGQAREAIAKGADVVVAVGGDGTVRAVADALTGTGVPMGLMPLGTGNLLARNLDLPISDPLAALQIAIEGRDRTIDVGRLHVVRWATDDEDSPAEDDAPDTRERDHLFLVIAGLGFDAAMVADTDDTLKAKVGWFAYFVSGFRHLHGRRTRITVRLDDGPTTSTKLRSLLVGNCGRLPGGITLLPDAVLDDGILDVAAIDTRGGIAGWAQLFGEVMMQGAGVKNELPAKIGRIDHTRAKEVALVVAGGEHVQVDGDIVGKVAQLTAHVDPGALVVRVPRTA